MDIDIYEDFEEIHVKDVYIVDVFSDPTPVVLLENLGKLPYIYRSSGSPFNRERT